MSSNSLAGLSENGILLQRGEFVLMFFLLKIKILKNKKGYKTSTVLIHLSGYIGQDFSVNMSG